MPHAATVNGTRYTFPNLRTLLAAAPDSTDPASRRLLAQVDRLAAAEEVVPLDFAGRRSGSGAAEEDAPVRPPPRGLQCAALGDGQPERSAVVDRRQAAAALALAAGLELVGGLMAGVEAAARLQPLGRIGVEGEPVGLAISGIGVDPEPRKVPGDRVRQIGP